jgi:hypothetical protein
MPKYIKKQKTFIDRDQLTLLVEFLHEDPRLWSAEQLLWSQVIVQALADLTNPTSIPNGSRPVDLYKDAKGFLLDKSCNSSLQIICKAIEIEPEHVNSLAIRIMTKTREEMEDFYYEVKKLRAEGHRTKKSRGRGIRCVKWR